jgi:hypothetical protein
MNQIYIYFAIGFVVYALVVWWTWRKAGKRNSTRKHKVWEHTHKGIEKPKVSEAPKRGPRGGR